MGRALEDGALEEDIGRALGGMIDFNGKPFSRDSPGTGLDRTLRAATAGVAAQSRFHETASVVDLC